MLTDKQENFARAVALEGMTQADAYRSAYNTENMSDAVIYNEASALASHHEVSVRINELRSMTLTPKVMSAQERLEWLTRVVKGEEKERRVIADGDVVDCEADLNAKMKAIDIMNKMQGEYVTKVEADVKGDMNISIELVDDDE